MVHLDFRLARHVDLLHLSDADVDVDDGVEEQSWEQAQIDWLVQGYHYH